MNLNNDCGHWLNVTAIFVRTYNLFLIGDKIVGIGYTVLKVRLKNSDIQKGKSAGYRVIYQIKDNRCVLLLIIYSKSDQTDISTKKLKNIISNFETL